ncbi:Hsp70 family protein [Streptomyces sp. PU-14G]|uniref:Hsp70 family protein n=1 Tax=Streptomyces sp. PU-14G TaxID=2800808 RepID=UPI0034DE4F34
MEPLREGDPARIAEYRILGRLGEGGMGVVYLARTPRGRLVAVKTVRAELAAIPDFRRRFAWETVAAQRVGGQWTAQVLAAGPDAQVPWVATAYIAGPTLHEVVSRYGPLPERSVRVLAARLAQALADIHLSLIHRDLKPSNVMMTLDGPKVIDFGVARAVGSSLTTVLTAGGATVGTPAFMSPEQARGEHLSGASDVFSLGSVLAFAARGRAPFEAADGQALALMYQVAHAEPDLAGVPAALRGLISSCLAKAPADRPSPRALREQAEAGYDPSTGWLPPQVLDQLARDAVRLLDQEDPLTHPFTTTTPSTDDVPGYTRPATPPAGTPRTSQPPYDVRNPPVGIDLGTTNSVVSAHIGGNVRCIPNSEGLPVTPSLVAVTAEGRVLTGAAAERQALTNPAGTVRSVMLKLGTDWSMTRGGVRLTAHDAVRLLLTRLREDAEAYLGASLGVVALTVPAVFGFRQRKALAVAAEAAGMRVARMVSGPVATGVAYHWDQWQEDATVLVLDLGGGTLDVSLLQVGDGVVEVFGNAGDHLGGDDWDLRIVQHLTSRFRDRYGVDLVDDAAVMQRLREAAEKAKTELSTVRTTALRLPYLAHGPQGPLHLDETLSREEFESRTRDLLERCLQPVERALSDAALTYADIDRVVLAGGAARMPAVDEWARRLAGGREPWRRLITDGAATGAALEAGVLAGAVKDVLTLHACPTSVSVEVQGETAERILHRNTTLPTKRSERFTTCGHEQGTVVLHVVEGERREASANRTLAVLVLDGVPPAARGVPVIEVTTDLDPMGLLHVTAEDLGTGRVVRATVDDTTIQEAATLVRSPRWARLRELAPVLLPPSSPPS